MSQQARHRWRNALASIRANIEVMRELLGDGTEAIAAVDAATLLRAVEHAMRAASLLPVDDSPLQEPGADEAEEVARLERSLRDTRVQLGEVHHRVKNNLHIVSSLLYLQSRHVEHSAARAALLECRDRVHSIALAHELLQDSVDGATVDLARYLERVVDAVRQAWVPGGGVLLVPRLTPVLLDVDRAVSCGLLVTEVVTNAFRHAFPDHRMGTVCVELVSDGATITLSVLDDGVGLSPGAEAPRSLGFSLVRSLGEQLGGTVEVDGARGTVVRVVFPAERA